MVLLVLALLWAIVLVPPALRNRAEARQGRSVKNFRKRLDVLAPPVPRATRPPSAVRPAGSAPPRMALLASPELVARRTVPSTPKRTPPAGRPVPAPPARPGPAPAGGGRTTAPSTRAGVFRRRRRVFAGLCLTAILTLGVAIALPGLRTPVLAGHVVADLALAAYVAGLRRLRRLARERAVKVHYLPLAVQVREDAAGESEAEAEAEAEIPVPAARSASL